MALKLLGKGPYSLEKIVQTSNIVFPSNPAVAKYAPGCNPIQTSMLRVEVSIKHHG